MLKVRIIKERLMSIICKSIDDEKSINSNFIQFGNLRYQRSVFAQRTAGEAGNMGLPGKAGYGGMEAV